MPLVNSKLLEVWQRIFADRRITKWRSAAASFVTALVLAALLWLRTRQRRLSHQAPERTRRPSMQLTDCRRVGVVFFVCDASGNVSKILLGAEERTVNENNHKRMKAVLDFPQGKAKREDDFIHSAERAFSHATGDPVGLAKYLKSAAGEAPWPINVVLYETARIAVVFCEVEDRCARPLYSQPVHVHYIMQPVWVDAKKLRSALSSGAASEVTTDIGNFPICPIARRFFLSGVGARWVGFREEELGKLASEDVDPSKQKVVSRSKYGHQADPQESPNLISCSAVPKSYRYASVVFFVRGALGNVSKVLLGVEAREVISRDFCRDLGLDSGTNKTPSMPVLLFPQGKVDQQSPKGHGCIDTAKRGFIEATGDPMGLTKYFLKSHGRFELPVAWYERLRLAVILCEMLEEDALALPTPSTNSADLPMQLVWVGAKHVQRAVLSESPACEVTTDIGNIPLFPTIRHLFSTDVGAHLWPDLPHQLAKWRMLAKHRERESLGNESAALASLGQVASRLEVNQKYQPERKVGQPDCDACFSWCSP